MFGENRVYAIGDSIYKINKYGPGNMISVRRYFYCNGNWLPTQDIPFYVLKTRPVTIIN